MMVNQLINCIATGKNDRRTTGTVKSIGFVRGLREEEEEEGGQKTTLQNKALQIKIMIISFQYNLYSTTFDGPFS